MSECMNKLIQTASQTLKSKLRGILAAISADLDILFQRSLVARDEARDSKIRDFAIQVKRLRERHELLLQTVEDI